MLLLIWTLSLCGAALSDEIIGCGGFIKSHTDIDFSQVEVKLMTKQGAVKDKTDCSPSNGYYFLPLYDKGDFILKISPPPGWSFEPESIEILFDGKTDLCSQGKDVNFTFKGFGITGKIAIADNSAGAKGVSVQLVTEKGSVISTTLSDSNGVFSFTPIIPGKYKVRVSHPRWQFENTEYLVNVDTGNTVLPANALRVVGFDVTGRILSDGADLQVNLYTKKGQNAKNIKYRCASGPISKYESNNADYDKLPVCTVDASKSTGQYTFVGLPPGNYLVVPLFSNKEIQFHIKPGSIEVEIVKDSVTVGENFEITGMSVKGRVLMSANGWGVPNAKIKLNGEVVTTTHTDGSYVLKNIKSGSYTIQVVAASVKVEDHTVKISSSNPAVVDLIVSAFEVCGQIVSPQSHTVAIENLKTNFYKEVVTKLGTGEWCVFLPNGLYKVKVLTSNSDQTSGIQFFPLTQNIEVKSSPMSGIIFSQLRATVTGVVKCLPDSGPICQEITITMNALDNDGKPNGQYITAALNDGKYTFSDILPGPYEVTVPATTCWKANSQRINIKTAKETIPDFEQTGFAVSFVSSHQFEINYKLVSQRNAPLSHTLESGLTKLCLDMAGVYDLTVNGGCHSFDSLLPKTFTTSHTEPIPINALKHVNKVLVRSNQAVDLKLVVEKDGRNEITVQEKPQKIGNSFVYSFEIMLKPKEAVKISPVSNLLLFKPESANIVGGNDCVEGAFTFVATVGLIIEGKTEPAIKDTTITLSFPKNGDLAQQIIVTSASGEFKFGPIDSEIEYELVAEKESYVFSKYDHKSGTFKAHKLCEVVVFVYGENGQKLSGVLLTLSGAESYRKNLVTGDEGKIMFHSLTPSHYYLRPMMKEYRFEPSSKMINVTDGQTVSVELHGTRVAYSLFGKITTLNGQSFPNVLVEASAKEPCASHQEEASSEATGVFRVRGLNPGCLYTVNVKRLPNDNVVDRTIPKNRVIEIVDKDIQDVNFVGISPLLSTDVNVRITASNNDFYRTLRLTMTEIGVTHGSVYSQRVETPLNPKSSINPGILVLLPRIPFDGKTYVIELSTSLSDKTYKYTLPSIQFVANASTTLFELDFSPEVRHADNDFNQNSISALVLIALVALAFFRQDLLLEGFTIVWNQSASFIQEAKNRSSKKDSGRYEPEPFDDKTIDQLAQSINATKKKKVKKIN